jgi:putative membrane protein
MIRAALLLLLAASGAAQAHDGATSAPGEIAWSFEVMPCLLLAICAGLYAVGAVRLWRRSDTGRHVQLASILAFSAGWLVLATTLVSPLHMLSEQLFAAHMIEHQLLMEVAAPLIILARPLGVLLWGLPKNGRQPLAQALRWRPLVTAWTFMARPLVATITHGVAIWAWHAPAFFRAALEHEWMHWLQHASFFGTALLFWWAMLRSQRAGRAQAIGHLFATSVHTGLLGALLVFSPRPWFQFQSAGAAAFGLTSLEDQQLAGLIMWVPGGLIYVVAALAVAGALLSAPAAGARQGQGS